MRELPQPLRKSQKQWQAEKHCRPKRGIFHKHPPEQLRAEKHRRRMRVSGGCEARDLRQTSLAAREAKLGKTVRQAIYSKLRSIAARTSALYRKLSPDGWPLRILHFLADSGVVLHSLIRLCSPDCWSSARIPSSLIFFMKYSASVTAASSM